MGKGQWVTALVGVVFLVILMWLGYGFYLRYQVRSVLDDVRTLSVASDHTAAFEALRHKYGNRLKSMEGCSEAICSYDLSVSNHAMSAAFRVPYTELNARFDLRGRSVVTVMVEYRSAQSVSDSPVVHVQIDFCPASCGHFFVHPWTRSGTAERWNGIVEMGFATAEELREAALALNPRCLTNMRGCSDIAQLLPSVWESSGTGVRCLVPNLEGQAR